jgi:polyisoprenoid-binding protein YceI
MLALVERCRSIRRAAYLAAFVSLLVLRSLCAAQQIQVTLDPAQTKIEWTLGATLHTVHGTFKLKSGVVKFDPRSGDASGEIIVDATSGESGNHDRDADMHNKVLESQRYPEINFVPRRVTGNLAEQGKSNLQVRGTFTIRGADHDFTLPMTIAKTGETITASASFTVPYQGLGHEESQQDLPSPARGEQSRRQRLDGGAGEQLAISCWLSAVSMMFTSPVLSACNPLTLRHPTNVPPIRCRSSLALDACNQQLRKKFFA